MHHNIEDAMADLALLDMLTAPMPPAPKGFLRRRDADLDPLLLAAAAASPHITRNHYAHDFFPGVQDPRRESSYDWTNWKPEDPTEKKERKPRLKYVSMQMPRSQRMKQSEDESEKVCNLHFITKPLYTVGDLPLVLVDIAECSSIFPGHRFFVIERYQSSHPTVGAVRGQVYGSYSSSHSSRSGLSSFVPQ